MIILEELGDFEREQLVFDIVKIQLEKTGRELGVFTDKKSTNSLVALRNLDDPTPITYDNFRETKSPQLKLLIGIADGIVNKLEADYFKLDYDE